MSRVAVLILSIVFVLMITTVVSGQDVEISIPPTTGASGENVTIPIHISDTTGWSIIAAELVIQYDPQVLTAIDANVSGAIATDWFVQTNTGTSGQIIISMMGMNPLSGSGKLLNVRFSVSITARGGSTYLITFSKALLNEGIPNAVTSPGIFTVGGESAPTLEGDANGDDRVNHLDILEVILAYSKNSGESGYNPWADFNSDGRVNRQDMVILLRNYGATKN